MVLTGCSHHPIIQCSTTNHEAGTGRGGGMGRSAETTETKAPVMENGDVNEGEEGGSTGVTDMNKKSCHPMLETEGNGELEGFLFPE